MKCTASGNGTGLFIDVRVLARRLNVYGQKKINEVDNNDVSEKSHGFIYWHTYINQVSRKFRESNDQVKSLIIRIWYECR